ncbi:MAG: intradiol ring-cleavage dioxygenase [Rubrivivax sp.]
MNPSSTPARRPPLRRRSLLACTLAWPALAAADRPRRLMAPMTDGPFYPPSRWRARSTDWDADLTQVRLAAGVQVARGEHLALQLAVVDRQGRPIDGAEVEIWQCDVLAAYRHPHVPEEPGRFDPGFQGFGAALSARDGGVRFRTIRPVAYPGRTPHVHVKLRHAAFGELTSQLFVAGDPGNAADGLWRQLPAADRDALAMRLQPAGDDGLRWRVQHELVVPG